MWETPDDIRRLQGLIDAAFAGAESPQFKALMTPDMAMTADEVAAMFSERKVAVLSTVSSRCEPISSPVDVFMVNGRFQFGTTKGSLRARHMKKNAAVSLCFYLGDDYAVIVHGTAIAIDASHPEFDDADRAWTHVYGASAMSLAPDVLYYRVNARRMVTRDWGKRKA